MGLSYRKGGFSASGKGVKYKGMGCVVLILVVIVSLLAVLI